ncbi:protein-glutamate methylesterase/protein-glutamine glutaminase [Enterovirga aerilata]|uniref:Protein-glutamate methylesterase/protein-glutamine glutaminase n=1 Tax=Enterovirga aerilata TaxID=2730920 RepID=A0A849I1E6_9HYPH|nr:chemotaxis response regulator protein-glutamate methylesterase [Enterovirga sp. DB1703]NNM71191.1 chemotaxis response regulator protein-glutamate methylesterase [Enterovirga sp. DB1703]
MTKTTVLVVDDSLTMRSIVSAMLQSDPEIEVVGTAGDPLQAREAIKALNPDVVTLDIEMPNMNGLEFLEKIMRLRPMPVIMISTLTQQGADASIRALELGAFDCVGKPSGGVTAAEAFAELPAKVKAAKRSRPRQANVAGKPPAPAQGFEPNGKVVAIGSSTGGVEALLTIISRFPANCPPTVITQHMPATFTGSFAQRLDRFSAARVAEAKDGAPLLPGHVYLAPGGSTHLEISGSTSFRCRLRESGLVNGHRPSVDRLFESVTATVAENAVGVILTGMGRDGAQGLLGMRRAGAATIGQDEPTSVVYGMPRVAFEIGAVERQLPLSRIAGEVLRLCNQHSEERV